MNVEAKHIDQKGKALGSFELPEAVFAVKAKDSVLTETVIMQLASRRQGTAKTKGRSEVRGGGKKPFKQKGTGNARRGTSRSPLIVGGGRIFGPVPRDYSYRMPAKVRAQAIKMALSKAAKAGTVVVVKEFASKTPKTKDIQKLLGSLEWSKVLVVDSKNEILSRSVRNVRDAKYLAVEGLNVFDILKYKNILMSESAVTRLKERFAS